MPELLGPLRATLAQARRRRSLLLLLVAFLSVAGVMAWSSYPSFREEHARLQTLEAEGLTHVGLARIIGGYGCSQKEDQKEVCQLTTRYGTPFGPRFDPEEPVGPFGRDRLSPDELAALEPEVVAAQRATVEELEERLAPARVFQSRARALGTFWGILFAGLFGATFFGAEWRWGVWPALLTHEPRRGRLLAGRFAALWMFIAAALALALVLTVALDAIFRAISDVGASGGPSAWALVGEGVRALLPPQLFATLAGAVVVAVRTSFAGVAPLALIVADIMATRRWVSLRHILPSQSIAWLLPQLGLDEVTSGYIWTEPITSQFVCPETATRFQQCQHIALEPIPDWRATVVLLAWLAAGCVAGWLVLRARDAPQ